MKLPWAGPLARMRLIGLAPLSRSPLSSLAVALPRMLEQIEAELTTAGPVKARRLRQRAQLILDLLAPEGQSPIPSPQVFF